MYVLESLRWFALLHFGLVVSSLQCAAQLASLTFQQPSPKLRTKLLSDTIKHSKLNANAPMLLKKRAANADKWLQG